MLKPNQVKRLLLHTQSTLDNVIKLSSSDQNHIIYRQGYIQALKTVLNMDPETINNKSIEIERPISNCCGWPPLSEIDDNIGHCSKCKDHCEFIKEESDR